MHAQIASRFAPFGTTIFAEMTRLANEHNAVNLSQGFPDFDGPDELKQAMIDAVGVGSVGKNQYARSAGEPVLVSAIANDWRERTGIEVDPMSQVTVTTGCTEALAAIFLGLFEPGDEVILMEPYYDAYLAGCAMAGVTPKFVQLAPNRSTGQFEFDPEQIRNAVSPRTRAMVLNTPHNPTGKVFSRDELESIASICREHDLILISDEVYEHLVLDDSAEHLSPMTLQDMADRTVVCSSIGKTCSVTGWKVGWTIASAELSAGVRSAHQFLTFATHTPTQHAAASIISAGLPHVSRLRDHLRMMRNELSAALVSAGFGVFHAPAGYFVMADYSSMPSLGSLNDREVCQKLITDAGIATIPPSSFCQDHAVTKGLVRFAFCKHHDTIRKACHQLANWA
ncbi:MAG: aminotransferase class I/II-fold pyridoxal phosphate-dependent enzyme [Phycisphaeraceae bacterium]|nr:aminotransferase class I/II-fold pyridoxal phosphate-dependent enzyme [Phycisphaerales bacterium]MCB9861683.1 aminotransferase class I/II-fold pyridoxal phosphate-dependent enzyme [Phycisphaeraceae bacterium]